MESFCLEVHFLNVRIFCSLFTAMVKCGTNCDWKTQHGVMELHKSVQDDNDIIGAVVSGGMV